jgi:hypothetical protein
MGSLVIQSGVMDGLVGGPMNVFISNLNEQRWGKVPNFSADGLNQKRNAESSVLFAINLEGDQKSK